MSNNLPNPNMKPLDKVLVVDDDPEIRALLIEYLSQNGFDVTGAANADEMDPLLESFSPDLMLLDIMMPGRDGISVCTGIRATSWLPIIMLTAKNTDIDRILGIEVGADDYMTKPFNPRELLARIKSVLRRSRAPQPKTTVAPASTSLDQPGIYQFQGWALNTNTCVLSDPDGMEMELTAGEFDLLHALVLSSGRAVSRAQLLQLTHGVLGEAYERSVDVLISRLRTKLTKDPTDTPFIKTVRNVGYLFAVKVTGTVA